MDRPLTQEEQEIADKQLIQQGYDQLLEDYKQSGHNLNFDLVDKAFNFANSAHAGVRRRSGEPYMLHPIAVARIVVGEIGLGTTSVCAALLHDVVEDTNYTVEDIEGLFGKKIASIVDGLTKISGGVFAEQASSQAENFRKLLLTISDDVRVILIKIADRLHNMRTLTSMPKNKQHKIAGETLYIYAPLAHRLGLFHIKTELEDLSFKYEHPELYIQLKQRLDSDTAHRDELFGRFIEPIKRKLDQTGYDYSITKRIKTIFSIYHKMQVKNVPFEEIYDLMAVRIVYQPKEGLDEKAQAWMIYSAITTLYRPHPDRIRDWISTPKANGYEALHVTVMGPDGQWIEVQIRSQRMHEIAERGISAHWKYKQNVQDSNAELDKWLNQLKEILSNPEPSALDFLDTFKLNLFTNEIFVFTPKGEIRTMPQGSTSLDFAFMLHTDVGLHCIGAKVNHKLMPLSQKLESGDQVEVLTSKTQIPQRQWLDYTTTASAKNKLKAYFRKQDRIIVAKGKAELEEYFKDQHRDLDQQTMQMVMNHFEIRNPNTLYYEVGRGVIPLEHLIETVFKTKKKGFKHYLTSFVPNAILPKSMKRGDTSMAATQKAIREDAEAIVNATAPEDMDTNPVGFDPSVQGFKTSFNTQTKGGIASDTPSIDKKKVLYLSTDSRTSSTPYELADCCGPIPGDDVLAFIDEGSQSVTLHSTDCPVASALKAQFGERIVMVQWVHSEDSDNVFPAKLGIDGIDKQGVLFAIMACMAERKVNVQDVHLTAKDGIFRGEIKVLIKSNVELERMLEDIRKIKDVNNVIRKDK